MNKLFITNDDKCLYQKRYLVGSTMLVAFVYFITMYIYHNNLLAIGLSSSLFIFTIFVDKKIILKPKDTFSARIINYMVYLSVFIQLMVMSIEYISDDPTCNDGNPDNDVSTCKCKKEYKILIVGGLWSFLMLLILLHKFHLLERIVNIPKRFKNIYMRLCIISLLMVFGSLFLSVGETAPVIILFSAVYWDSFEIGNGFLLNFLSPLFAFLFCTVILCISVCIVFFEMGKLLPKDYIITLFNCLGYGEEYSKIKVGLLDKAKDGNIAKIIFMLRLSPLLPYQWISVIFGNVMKDRITMYIYVQYVLFSVLGVLIPILPYLLMGFIANRTIKSHKKVNAYFIDNSNGIYWF
jgi:hypothetical protein